MIGTHVDQRVFNDDVFSVRLTSAVHTLRVPLLPDHLRGRQDGRQEVHDGGEQTSGLRRTRVDAPAPSTLRHRRLDSVCHRIPCRPRVLLLQETRLDQRGSGTPL